MARWWERPGLEVEANGRLAVRSHDVETLAREAGTPLYVIDSSRVVERARALHDSLGDRGVLPKVRLALKAQREPRLLSELRHHAPFLGIDVCSPGEIDWALGHGWKSDEISYTGTNVSDRDLDRILPTGVHMNVDLLTQLDRFGRHAPGSAVGLRVNPRIGASKAGGGTTFYTGTKPTKFGVFSEQIGEALEIASRHGLTLDTVHFHVADGYLDEGLPDLEETLRRVVPIVEEIRAGGHPVSEVNVGGGLGVPETEADGPLSIETWADLLVRHLGPLGVAVGVEPGDFLVKDAVLLAAEVVTVERRDGIRFVGLDVGWNVMCEHFVYGAPIEWVLARGVTAEALDAVTVSGHINEGNDLFAEDHPLPEVSEGDVLVGLNVGSYNGSMTSLHCLREPAGVLVLPAEDVR